VANSRNEVRLTFNGGPTEMLNYALLLAVSAVLVVPFAWAYAAFLRWIARSTQFSDGTSAEFRGSGDEVVVWCALGLLMAYAQRVLFSSSEIGGTIAVLLIGQVLAAGIGYTILKWLAFNLRLNPGPQLTFIGSFPKLLGWSLLLILSFCTIVGWAWVAVAQMRWIASETKGEGVAFEFRAAPIELLWRGFATLFGSLAIVTIPYLLVWFYRWLISNIVIIRGVETEWGGFIEEQRTPQKPSWPAVPPLHRHLD
jgi:hypothetical protein